MGRLVRFKRFNEQAPQALGRKDMYIVPELVCMVDQLDSAFGLDLTAIWWCPVGVQAPFREVVVCTAEDASRRIEKALGLFDGKADGDE